MSPSRVVVLCVIAALVPTVGAAPAWAGTVSQKQQIRALKRANDRLQVKYSRALDARDRWMDRAARAEGSALLVRAMRVGWHWRT